MKIALSKTQWEFIGKKTGWIKAAEIKQTFNVLDPNGNVIKTIKSTRKNPVTHAVIGKWNIEERKKEHENTVKKLTEYVNDGNWTKESAQKMISESAQQLEEDIKNADKYFLLSSHRNLQLAMKSLQDFMTKNRYINVAVTQTTLAN